jgi:hypothetical protein
MQPSRLQTTLFTQLPLEAHQMFSERLLLITEKRLRVVAAVIAAVELVRPAAADPARSATVNISFVD